MVALYIYAYVRVFTYMSCPLVITFTVKAVMRISQSTAPAYREGRVEAGSSKVNPSVASDGQNRDGVLVIGSAERLRPQRWLSLARSHAMELWLVF